MATRKHSTSDTVQLKVTPWPDTPEGVMTGITGAFKDNPLNLINCLLERARCAAIVLDTQFWEEDGNPLSNHIVSGLLWTIYGNIQMVQHLMNPSAVPHADD